MAEDDYILITGSHNLSDLNDNNDINEQAQKEGDASSRLALERQGVFLDIMDDSETAHSSSGAPQDDFSKELQELSGIEIIPNEEDIGTNY